MIIKILLIAAAIIAGLIFLRRPALGGHLAVRRILGYLD